MVGLKKWSFTHIITLTVLVKCVSATDTIASETALSNFYTYKGENVSATLTPNRLTIKCGPGTGSTVPFKNIQNVETVEIFKCLPPDESYAIELRTLNVNTIAVQELVLTQVIGDMPLMAKHFKGLNIKKLNINNSHGSLVIPTSNALESLTELTELRLVKAQLPPLLKASNVKNITVKVGSVSGYKLRGCNELRELNLFSTYPGRVPSHWLENCTKLQILRVSGFRKPMTQESLTKVLEGALNLQELDLTSCKLSMLPWDLLTKAKQLRRLILRKNYLTGIELRNFKMNSVNYVDLTGCHIDRLKGLPVSNASHLEVNLSNNYLSDVQLEDKDYDMLEKNNMTVKVTAAPINLNCYDCKHGSLWRAVREKRLIIDAQCNEGVKLGDADHETRDRAECETYDCEKVSQCQCKRAWRTRARWAHCENAKLTTLPREPGLLKLYAAGNDIHNIYADGLLDSLQFLDLRNNSISLVNVDAVEKLFSVPERHVLFSGNPIACVCDNKVLLDVLRSNKNQVDDYNSITCDNGTAISQLDPADLCTTRFPVQQFSSVSIYLGIALVVLTVICLSLLVLYYRYKLTIKVFLYTRGWCLCCVREEELDADRPYDAFVSFSHEDASVVVEELVPKLENPPFSHKMCVHYRDWVPGELISEQIKTSVAQSRRTIIVLSRNYMKSIWGLLEFREAHINTLREGRVRVIVIVLDDVLEDENLDLEWRAYLKANTYVKWGDPWFWDKLKYALPHRTRERII